MVILFGASINKYNYFLTSDKSQPKALFQIVLQIKIVIILEPLPKKKKFLFFCDFPILAKYHFKLKNKSENSWLKSSIENFALAEFMTLTTLATTSIFRKVKHSCTIQESGV